MSVSIAGNLVECMTLRVNAGGTWTAEASLMEAASLSGRVSIDMGAGVHLNGTVTESGTHALRSSALIVGGANGWGKTLPAKHYASDTGVRARTIVEDLCRESGETLGTFVPAADRLGKSYVRDAVRASTTLECAIGDVRWWVDYAGTTNVGPRPAASMNRYELLAYDPVRRVVELALEDLSQLAIGAVLTDRLDQPQTIQSFTVTADRDGIRASCWTGGDSRSDGQLARLIRGIVTSIVSETSPPQFARCRVLGYRDDGRLEVQPVRRGQLPEMLPVSIMSGSGIHTVPAIGSEVLVGFADSSRDQPFVVSFVGRDGAGFEPDSIVIGTAGTTAKAAARVDDSVEVTLPPASFAGKIGGVDSTGTVTWTVEQKAQGVITSGSALVEVA